MLHHAPSTNRKEGKSEVFWLLRPFRIEISAIVTGSNPFFVWET